jgi:hypothetical protein
MHNGKRVQLEMHNTIAMRTIIFRQEIVGKRYEKAV